MDKYKEICNAPPSESVSHVLIVSRTGGSPFASTKVHSAFFFFFLRATLRIYRYELKYLTSQISYSLHDRTWSKDATKVWLKIRPHEIWLTLKSFLHRICICQAYSDSSPLSSALTLTIVGKNHVTMYDVRFILLLLFCQRPVVFKTGS